MVDQQVAILASMSRRFWMRSRRRAILGAWILRLVGVSHVHEDDVR